VAGVGGGGYRHAWSNLVRKSKERDYTEVLSIDGRIMLDCRLGSRSRGYHPVAPGPVSCRPFVLRL
jgi:hypothetical protein